VRRRFTIETVVVTGPARHQRQEAQTRPPGARWSVTVDVGSLPRNRDEVVCIELVDRSIEEDAAAHEWENRPGIPKWTARPIAGTAVYRN